MARFLPDGQVDVSFGTNGDGIVTIDFNSTVEGAEAVVVRGDGKITVVGTTFDALSPAVWVALARLNPDGSFDSSFSGDGKSVTNVHASNVRDAAFQPDRKLVVLSTHSLTSTSKILRLLDDGSFRSG